jgi:hypothetical protein
MKILKQWYYLPIIIILVLLVIGRIKLYGDPHLSVPMRDTDSFVLSSEVPIFSWEAISGRRLFTTNLLYKIFTPPEGYPNVEASVDTSWRRKYPGFGNIALFQSVASIIGWGFLAISLSTKLKNTLLKILSTVLILLFGFSPQVADWDSVLSAEALTFSFFALSFGLLIWLFLNVFEHKKNNPRITALAILWFIIFFLWTFVRDTNLYALFVTLVMLFISWIAFREYRRTQILVVIGIALLISLGLGLTSSMKSERSNIQIEHSISKYILPYPARTEFMYNLGMPSPESSEFEVWFDKYAPRSYMLFLIAHPGFTLSYFFHGTYVAFDPYLQSYFRAPQLQWRTHLINIGGILHPDNIAWVIAVLLLFVLWLHTISNKSENHVSKAWTWITTWLFMVGSSTMFISIFGDTVALHRHAIFSTTVLRLLMWILIIVLSDLLLLKNHNEET